MNQSTPNLQQQLRQAIIKQKAYHLEAVEDQSPLRPLYQVLYQYEEHVSKLVFQVFQGNGSFIPFELMDVLEREFQNSTLVTDPENQRLLHHYQLYKQRLDEIYNLLRMILATNSNGE